MTDAPSLDVLARRYLDLWQDQMARMARDPATAETVARTFSLMTKSAEAFAAAKVKDWPEAFAAWGGSAPNGPPSTAPSQDGAAPSAAVPGDGRDDVSWLVGRIASLEERVAELERRLANTEGAAPAASAPPTRRPKRPARSSQGAKSPSSSSSSSSNVPPDTPGTT